MTTPLHAAIAAFVTDLHRQAKETASPFIGPFSATVGDYRVFIDGVVDVETALRAALTVLREPDEGMILVAFQTLEKQRGHYIEIHRDDLCAAFTAMIEEAAK